MKRYVFVMLLVGCRNINESMLLKPVYVHISSGSTVMNATKIWITRSVNYYLCHDKSKILEKTFKNMMRMIEAVVQKRQINGLSILGRSAPIVKCISKVQSISVIDNMLFSCKNMRR